MSCKLLALGAALAMAAMVSAQSRRVTPLGEGAKRVALVVGNGRYATLPRLLNTTNDARDMAAALREDGFTVIEREDAARESFDTAVDQFVHQLQPGDVALFYYSGHGMQINGENYLPAIDFAAENEVQAKNRAPKAGEILEEMEASGAALNIVVLDACRTAYTGSRAIGGRGLAQMNAGKGTLLAYATSPGSTADDNAQARNGLYTTYLLQALREPGLPLEQVFKRAGGMVQRTSGGKQIPWIASSVDGDFYFKPGSAPASLAEPAPSRVPDAEAWEAVRTSGNADALQAFLTEFPTSQYAPAARVKLAALQPGPRPSALPVAAPPARPQTRDSKVNPKDGLTYVWIPPGRFMMGCSPGDMECFDDEKPAHEVAIPSGFWLGQTPVTQQAYQRVTGQNPSSYKGANLPVETVSWEEAQSYCQAIGGRLPTEAEWEYAARAGTTGARYGDLDQIAWYSGNSGNRTHEVGQKQPNAWGLFDMLGNVWQWAADWYTEGQYRALRGGSWSNDPRSVRVSNRFRFEPGYRNYNFGFRCVGE